MVILWLACLGFLVYFTLGVGLIALNNLGTYNIGGAPNSFKVKFGSTVLLAIIGYIWYLLFTNVPFTVNLS